MRLPVTYAILALIATATNICAQDITFRLYSGPFDLWLAIVVGTGVGLVVKYILDKRYIFAFKARDVAHDTRTFLLYTLMGVVTTFIFWGFEFAFNHIFQTKAMSYVGAVIGLAIGYMVKYHLDKRFVFRVRPA